MQKKLLVGVIFLFNLSSFATVGSSWKINILERIQANPDSVQQVLQDTLSRLASPNDKLFALACRARAFRHQGVNDSVQHYVQRADSLMSDNMPDFDRVQVFEELAHSHRFQRHTTEALVYAEHALRLFTNLEDDRGLLRLHYLIANLLSDESRYDAAMQEYLIVAAMAERQSNDKFLGAALMNMGNLLSEQGLELEAMNKFKQAQNIFHRSGPPQNEMAVLINLGISQNHLEQYQEAVQTFQLASTLADSLGERGSYAQVLMNLGNVLKNTGQDQEARTAFQQSLAICEELEIWIGLVLNHISISNVENDLHNWSLAKIHAENALELIAHHSMPYETAKARGNLHRALAGLGDFKAALEEFTIMWEIEDSLLSAEKHEQILEMSSKYESEKKEKEILLLQQEQQQQAARSRFVLTLSSAIVLTLSLLLIIGIQRVRLSRKERALVEKEKDAIASELALKNQELQHYVQNLARTSNLLQQLKRSRETNNDNESVDQLMASVNPETGVFTWLEFEKRFLTVYPLFVEELTNRFEDLTPMQLRLAMFIRMNLSNKEIAYITSKSVRTIETTRYTLRKKLGLDRYESLSGNIQQF
ncbi:MAG: tetratricopeptide repeat protein [Candidatus Marinimicrobia bacterium]|nr:tetratricopeptide repeat protein [Candidatus Neomarinimicrobiota bacterium]